MSEIAEFTRHLGHYLPPPDVELVERAFEFSESAHRGQYRKSGEPYITHPLAVASILSQWRIDAQGLAAALLHDVMEDTSVTKTEIETTFGRPVAEMVDGVSKLDQIQFDSREDMQAESFRKMLLAMARDVRVILIKLADRLHNMRTLDAMAPAAPAAHRARDARHLRADREPARPERALPGAAGPVVQAHPPDALPRAVERDQGGARQPAGGDEPAARRDPRGAPEGRHPRLGHRPREDRVLGLQEDAREALHVLAGVRHLRRARAGDRSDVVLRGARRAARALQADPGQVQGLRRDPEGERLPVAAHDALRAVRDAAGSADPHPRDAPDRRVRRRGALALQDARRASTSRKRSARRTAGCRACSRSSPNRATARSFSRTSRATCSPRRSTCSRRRARSWRCRAARPRSTSRTACIPTSAIIASPRASTTSCCRCAPSSRTATTSRS